MAQARKKSGGGRGSRAFGEGVARAFAITAQMAMLCPTGTDELMRRELAGGADAGRRRANAAR